MSRERIRKRKRGESLIRKEKDKQKKTGSKEKGGIPGAGK